MNLIKLFWLNMHINIIHHSRKPDIIFNQHATPCGAELNEWKNRLDSIVSIRASLRSYCFYKRAMPPSRARLRASLDLRLRYRLRFRYRQFERSLAGGIASGVDKQKALHVKACQDPESFVALPLFILQANLVGCSSCSLRKGDMACAVEEGRASLRAWRGARPSTLVSCLLALLVHTCEQLLLVHIDIALESIAKLPKWIKTKKIFTCDLK